MLAVRVERLSKHFGNTRALDAAELAIQPGELFTLLGPSGCGKTTLLRLLAGLEEATAGRIYFGDRRVDGEPVHRRNVGMVFQNYALFPHMSVGENVKYGLKARQAPPGDIDRRAQEGLDLVGLAAYADRAPGQLSGGQQQRVALARALVTRPSVLLMDEPLSNLDARLRVSMRTEIRRMVKEAGITTLYVTHDQEEALAISDRIGVIEAGRLIQVGTPVEIYRSPAHRQVAAFVGACSFLQGQIKGGQLTLGGQQIRVNAPYEGPVEVGIRPEAFSLGIGPVTLTGKVVGESFLGPVTELTVQLDDGARVALTTSRPPGAPRVTLNLLPADLLLFRADTGEAIR